MKFKHLILACLLVVSAVLAISTSSAQDAPPSTLEERLSYAYGTVVARDLKNRGLPINSEQFMKAFKNVMNGGESLMSEAQISATFDENQLRMDEQNAQGVEKENLHAGKKFLAENGKKKGIKTTKSGLQYEVLKAGEGTKPTATDTVRVHYHGTLLDGTVFDSSVERGEPISFALNRVIPGWTEGLQLMPKGSKYRLYIPYNLAYGDAGAGKKIKPYSALIFEVELLDIK